MWTGPQIEAKSPRKQPGTLSRPRQVRRGEGKTGVGDTVKGKGVNQDGGEGDECHPDVTLLSTAACALLSYLLVSYWNDQNELWAQRMVHGIRVTWSFC
jgi:hypothetical protein